jgi:4-aminobutyrate aminotransferase-like enzyme/Ser/Thr protein kinase RdoA (MazF antagonist)
MAPTASIVQTAPRFTEHEASHIATTLYGLTVTATALPSERDQNFLLRDASGGRFVLKIANAGEAVTVLDLQNQVIRFLAGRVTPLTFPRLVPTRAGADMESVEASSGRKHVVRLLTWIDGVCLAKTQPHGRDVLSSLGRALAHIDAALVEFSHPAAHRAFHWDLRQAGAARELVALLPDPRRPVVERVFAEWSKIDWDALRQSTIHNDANDYNVLVGPAEGVTAILDYGDLVHTATVCELAIALAYVMLEKPDPIAAAARVVTAYHEVYPLTAAEVDALYTLALTRLCCSLCYAAQQTRDAPDNEYLSVSNTPAWSLLERLADMSPEWPRQVFRFACGLPVAPVNDVTNVTNVTSVTDARSVRTEDLLSSRARHIGQALSLSYRSPLHIVCGSRQYLYDVDGRRYLDCVNNVAHVGHSHPYVVRAAGGQMSVLNTNTRYLHRHLIEYAERLVATLPPPLSVVYLVCSGSEANELALRMAREYTGHHDVVVVDGAYHGNSSALIDLSPYKFDSPGGHGCPPYVHKVPIPDVYRGEHRGESAGFLYAAHVADAAQQSAGVAAFFCESALSCGGQVVLPPGYLRESYEAIRAAGGVCVADEVQTGFGRAGTHFWMFETQGVVPDIVTLGKPIGNGHPIGAVVTTPGISAAFANGMEYFNTFGGNPVSSATALAVLDVIRDEELQGHALQAGEHLIRGLQQLQEAHALIGDVRGTGLFLGIELVRNRETQAPADHEAAAVIERMKERGVLLSTDGPYHNVLKIKPPLVFSRVDADVLLNQLDDVLSEPGITRPPT